MHFKSRWITASAKSINVILGLRLSKIHRWDLVALDVTLKIKTIKLHNEKWPVMGIIQCTSKKFSSFRKHKHGHHLFLHVVFTDVLSGH